ncbi:MAG: hypothetical protein WAL98_01605 [Desulfatiglandaceae bacterium]
MTQVRGCIEVDMFSDDVDSDGHPIALSFKEVLEDVAEEYGCELTHFEVHQGTVSFSFDDEKLMTQILRILQTSHWEPTA